MTFDELVARLREQEIQIFDDGEALKLQAPKGIITPQLLEIITYYSADLQYLVRLGDVRVCPVRWEHKPVWKYSRQVRTFVCRACRKESAA